MSDHDIDYLRRVLNLLVSHRFDLSDHCMVFGVLPVTEFLEREILIS